MRNSLARMATQTTQTTAQDQTPPNFAAAALDSRPDHSTSEANSPQQSKCWTHGRILTDAAFLCPKERARMPCNALLDLR